MSTVHKTTRFVFSIILLMSMVMLTTPATFASDGHIGSKPDIGQGDGIPTGHPGTVRAGEQNVDGDGNQGSDPNSDGGDGIPNGGPIEGNGDGIHRGDGIPNGGPIEGDGHKGQGAIDAIAAFFYSLLSL